LAAWILLVNKGIKNEERESYVSALAARII